MKEIAIIGAGGLAREVASYLLNLKYRVVAFRGKPKRIGEKIFGLPIIPHENKHLKDVAHVLAIGNPSDKKKVIEKHYQNYKFPLIPVQGFIGQGVTIKKGVFYCPNVILTCCCTIDEFAFLNIKSHVAHNCYIGKYVNVNPNCSISGKVTIGEGTYLGADVTIRNGIAIGKWSLIGMGSVVVKDIPDFVVAYGNPCRVVRQNKIELRS